MLSYEVVMGDCDCLWEASCSAAEKPRGCCCFGRLQIIKTNPILFSKAQELFPRLSLGRYWLTEVIEDPNMMVWNSHFRRCESEGLKYLWLSDKKLAFR